MRILYVPLLLLVSCGPNEERVAVTITTAERTESAETETTESAETETTESAETETTESAETETTESAETETTETTESESAETSAADDAPLRGGGSIERIRPPQEAGSNYLRYALRGDPRIASVVRCDEDEATRTGSALRRPGVRRVFESVQWSAVETDIDSAAALENFMNGPLVYRYRLVVTVGGEHETLEGQLWFRLHDRGHVVVCPPDAQ